MTSPKKKTKRKSKEKPLDSGNMVTTTIYGIFHETDRKILKVSLCEDEMEVELGLGKYDDNCCIVSIPLTLFT
jgi:hypothetical protein